MINLSKLTKLMAQDTSRVKMFLQIYRREIPLQMTQLKNAIATHDHENISLMAHSIKSQSAYLDVFTIVRLAEKLELQSQLPEINCEILNGLFHELQEETKCVLDELNQFPIDHK